MDVLPLSPRLLDFYKSFMNTVRGSSVQMNFTLSQKYKKNRHFQFLSIIVPTFQEADNLRPLITRISAVMNKCDMAYEVIVVDDNSRDGSADVITRLAEEGHPIRMIKRIKTRGLSTAVIRGFQAAEGDLLACMDADLSHPPEALLRLIRAFDDPKVEFSIGSRYVPGANTDENWGLFRWVNSKLATLFARPFTQVKDPMSGFFMLPRTVFERCRGLNPIGYKIALELLVRCPCRNIVEIPIHFGNRKFGKSKLNTREQWNYIRHLKRLADFKLGEISYIVQFCLVGTTGMITDLLIYSLLISMEVPLSLARLLAIWVAITWNFWLNRRLTFSYSRKGSIVKQYLQFFGSCSLGAIVSWSIATLIPQKMGIVTDYILLAAIIGIGAGTFANFTLARFWVFKKLTTYQAG
jgi:dolichol-phosphate mannosyltransferase